MLLKGELSGDEDLVIEGRVEGNINMPQNVVTVSEQASVEASIVARTVIVDGDVRGDILAAEKVDIGNTGSVEGNISAQQFEIALGAHVRGSIDIKQWTRGKPAAATGVGSDVDPPDTHGASTS